MVVVRHEVGDASVHAPLAATRPQAPSRSTDAARRREPTGAARTPSDAGTTTDRMPPPDAGPIDAGEPPDPIPVTPLPAPSFATLLEACVSHRAYQLACRGGSGLHPFEDARERSRCATLLELPGVELTIQALRTCTLSGQCLPVPGECSLRGALPEGAPCQLGLQCQSGICTGRETECGVCERASSRGDECSAYGCNNSLVCTRPDGSSAICMKTMFPAGSSCERGTCQPPCTENLLCESRMQCLRRPVGVPVQLSRDSPSCTPARAATDPGCLQTGCPTGQTCDRPSGACKKSEAGDPCGPYMPCTPGFACRGGFDAAEARPKPFTCVAEGQRGDPCSHDRPCARQLLCAPDANGNAICQAPAYAGPEEPCGIDIAVRCRFGACTDLNVCPKALSDGAPCGEDVDGVCMAPAQCRAGACEMLEPLCLWRHG